MTQEQRGLDTRSSILAAAAEVFSEKGFYESGIDDICSQAGITKGAFYHHYRSKQQLMMELMERWMDQIALSIRPVELNNPNFLELLLSLPEAMKPAFTRIKGQLNLFLELYIKGLSDPELKVVSQRTYDKFTSFFSHIIEQGVKQGSIKKVDVGECSRILFSLTIGFMVQGLLDPDGADWIGLVKKSILMLLT